MPTPNQDQQTPAPDTSAPPTSPARPDAPQGGGTPPAQPADDSTKTPGGIKSLSDSWQTYIKELRAEGAEKRAKIKSLKEKLTETVQGHATALAAVEAERDDARQQLLAMTTRHSKLSDLHGTRARADFVAGLLAEKKVSANSPEQLAAVVAYVSSESGDSLSIDDNFKVSGQISDEVVQKAIKVFNLNSTSKGGSESSQLDSRRGGVPSGTPRADDFSGQFSQAWAKHVSR